ncbi:MAG: hypothetical protein AB1589_41455, partial [Cyanobacteriota bacterium]
MPNCQDDWASFNLDASAPLRNSYPVAFYRTTWESRGAGEQGSRGAGEQGSRGAGEQGRYLAGQ